MVTIPVHDAELTVMRRLASYAYGAWDVEWPDSVPESARPRVAEGRRLGYVADLHPDDRPGPMGRRFVREDVQITAHDNGVGGVSNVEHVLDAAADRTEGQTVVEKHITRNELGDLIPFVDFDVGDLVYLIVFDRLLPGIAVEEIRAVTQPGAVIDWELLFGSQLIENQAARDSSNRELLRLIAQERKDRAGDVGHERRERTEQVENVRRDTQSTIGVLGGDAATVDDLHSQLDGLASDMGMDGSTAVIPALRHEVEERFKTQAEIDELQDALIRELQGSLESVKRDLAAVVASTSETVVATQAGVSNDRWALLQAERPGYWGVRSPVFAQGTQFLISEWDQGESETQSVAIREIVPSGTGRHLINRVDKIRPNGTDGRLILLNYGAMVVKVQALAIPQIVQRINATFNPGSITGNTWTRIGILGTVRGTGTSDIDVSVTTTWPRAWGYYTIQIRAGSRVLGQSRQQGSSSIFFNRSMNHTLTVRRGAAAAGEVLSLWVLAQGQRGAGDLVTGQFSAYGSWTEGKE